ncbi:MAG: hypothetical protein R3D46_07045 [Defluviimonas denitrificans]
MLNRPARRSIRASKRMVTRREDAPMARYSHFSLIVSPSSLTTFAGMKSFSK